MNKNIWEENSNFCSFYGKVRSLKVKTRFLFILNIPFFLPTSKCIGTKFYFLNKDLGNQIDFHELAP